jgi:hypothetical protein
MLAHMSTCEISTGFVVTPTSPAPGYAPPKRRKSALFDAQSTSPTSKLIRIAEGEAVIFSGHSFSGTNVTLNQVWYSPGEMPQMGPCACPPRCLTLDPGHVDATQPFSFVCNGFVLNDCTSTLIMSLPGDYTLSLDDNSILGSVFIDYRVVKASSIPEGMLAGNTLATPPKVVAVIPQGTGYLSVYDNGVTAPLEL